MSKRKGERGEKRLIYRKVRVHQVNHIETRELITCNFLNFKITISRKQIVISFEYYFDLQKF